MAIFSKSVTIKYISGYNIVFNTQNIQYITKCTETAPNATCFFTHRVRRELQNWTPFALINVQLNAIDTADSNEMLALRKSHLHFPYLILWQYIFAATANAINAHNIQCLKYEVVLKSP